MNIYHFFPSSIGIRFLETLSKILRYEFGVRYQVFSKLKNLYDELCSRNQSSDIILITAHGTENCIYGEGIHGDEEKITLENSHLFSNSFVFAFSCSTAKLGQQMVDKNKVITYIGFNKDIPLAVKQQKSPEFVNELNKLLKEIYTQAVTRALDEFIKNGLTALEFVRLLQKRLLEIYVHAISLEPQKLATQFSISHRTANNETFYMRMSTHLLATINAVSSMIELYGERGFMPLVCINEWDTKKIIERLNRLEDTIRDEYPAHFYIHYVMSQLYCALKDNTNMYKHLRIVENMNPEYYRQLTNQMTKIS
ncbi:hypothetical protein Dtox_2439 [Desulfofarcimen acetoxidans DSM 771]|uniref:CHAT domain-containing protein n=1 Tax=Desulfofarcimen acetoxidans (strain ATCC 49208 / DSM 771 / KCTC 5769 / VKM B-1644 / 5575) TaxID=485916 RepID=C8W0J3_DESAS|nr:hypothetical protein [Desulfofarcimen acetoxidans]ACV63248.1 hypothetical protein Dtox_2439 [Desulfofarcimen acetoxidans DSM 771]